MTPERQRPETSREWVERVTKERGPVPDHLIRFAATKFRAARRAHEQDHGQRPA